MGENLYVMREKELIVGAQNIIMKNTNVKKTENVIMTKLSEKLYKSSIDRTINSRTFIQNLVWLKFHVFYEFSRLLVRPFNMANYALAKEKMDDYNYIKKTYETLTPLLQFSIEKYCNTKNIYITFDYNNQDNKNGIVFDVLYFGNDDFSISYSNNNIQFSDPDNTTLIIYVPVNFVIACVVNGFSEKASQEQKNINTVEIQYILEDVYQIISSYMVDSFKINAFVSCERNKFIQDINQFITQLIEFKQERLLYKILSVNEIMKLKSLFSIKNQNSQYIDDTQYDLNFINSIHNKIATYITSLYPKNSFLNKKTIYNFNELFIKVFSDEVINGINPFVMYKVFTELNNFEVKKILDMNRNMLHEKSINLLYNTNFTSSIEYLKNTMNCNKSDIISVVHYISNTLLFVFLYLGFDKNNIRLIEDYIKNIKIFLSNATNYNFNLSQNTYSVKQIAKKVNERIELFNSIKKITYTDLQRFIKLLIDNNE